MVHRIGRLLHGSLSSFYMHSIRPLQPLVSSFQSNNFTMHPHLDLTYSHPAMNLRPLSHRQDLCYRFVRGTPTGFGDSSCGTPADVNLALNHFRMGLDSEASDYFHPRPGLRAGSPYHEEYQSRREPLFSEHISR